MNDLIVYKENFCISTEKTKLDLKAIHDFLSNHAYWIQSFFPLPVSSQASTMNFTWIKYPPF